MADERYFGDVWLGGLIGGRLKGKWETCEYIWSIVNIKPSCPLSKSFTYITSYSQFLIFNTVST